MAAFNFRLVRPRNIKAILIEPIVQTNRRNEEHVIVQIEIALRQAWNVVNVRLNVARVEGGQCGKRNELMVINQSDVIGSLKPIGHLPISHDVDVAVLRKKFFKCAQTEAQFIIVAVPAFNIAKDGNAGSVYSGQITRMLLTLCAPFIIFAVDPQVNDVNWVFDLV